MWGPRGSGPWKRGKAVPEGLDARLLHTVSAEDMLGGLFHPKLLLFRTDSLCRVVIHSGNLMAVHWTACAHPTRAAAGGRADGGWRRGVREVLWAQDFPTVAKQQRHPDSAFGGRLHRYLERVLDGSSPELTELLNRIFERVDFGGARAALVDSLSPRIAQRPSGAHDPHTALPRLCKAVREVRQASGLPGEAPSPAGRLIVVSGSFGAMNGKTENSPPEWFPVDLLAAMRGRRPPSARPTWAQLAGAAAAGGDEGLVLLAPTTDGRRTDADDTRDSVWHFMDRHHYLAIPADVRRRLFAALRPQDPASPPEGVHAKAFLAEPHPEGDQGWVVYVGSHNFSRRAWGDGHGMQPANCELGVAMATKCATQARRWKQAFPAALPCGAAAIAEDRIAFPVYPEAEKRRQKRRVVP